jgi:hypothetical protein
MAAFEALSGVPREILYDRMKTAVIGEDTSGREETFERAFRSPPPTDLLPFDAGQRRFSGDGRLFGDVVFAGLPRFCDRKHKSDICRVDVLTS